jgi:hypothetical protein
MIGEAPVVLAAEQPSIDRPGRLKPFLVLDIDFRRMITQCSMCVEAIAADAAIERRES